MEFNILYQNAVKIPRLQGKFTRSQKNHPVLNYNRPPMKNNSLTK